MKTIKSSMLLFMVLTATTSIVFSQSAAANQAPDSTKTVTLKVKGITCGMDLKMIAANVQQLEGVSNCTYGKQGTTTSFEVTFNPTLVSEKDIHVAIENTGSCENPDERPYKVKQ